MSEKLTVNKRKDKDFRILQLTDTQIIDPSQMSYPTRLNPQSIERWADRDSNCLDYVRKLIEDTKPDFIVLTGDNVYGSFDNDGSNFKAFVSTIDGYGIPWSPVYGNHDGETFDLENPLREVCPWGKGYDWQIDYLLHNTKNCLFERGPAVDNSRHGNYVVEVKEGAKTVYALVMFDSHDGVTESYGLTDGQVNWYAGEIERLTNVPSVIFQHIPLYHHYLASLKYTEDGNGAVSESGTVLPNGDWGELRDRVSYTCDVYKAYSEKLWRAIQKYGSTKAVCVGHYHANAASIKYKGENDAYAVILEFGVKSSTFDYGDFLGGTVITLGEDEYPVIRPVYIDRK